MALLMSSSVAALVTARGWYGASVTSGLSSPKPSVALP
jgi:hypothetical protein